MAAMTPKMIEALELLTRHDMVLVSNQRPSGRHLGPTSPIASATARALERRGLCEVRRLEGRPDRDRGPNRVYASITTAGRAAAADKHTDSS